MEVTFLGHASFKIKGKSSVVVTDPYDESCGKYPKGIEANILTVSHNHEDHNQIENVSGSPFVINSPGEYEVGGTSVVGVASFHDDKDGSERGQNTMYVIEIDGLRLIHLGDLGHKLNQQQLEEIGPVDVIFVPVGGVYTLDAKQAVEVAKQLDPWVIIPMHYQTDELKLAQKLGGVEEFLKEMGKVDIQPIPKLVITADKLPEETQIVVLEKK